MARHRQIQGYIVTKEIDAEFGLTKANTQYGAGGLLQVFVPHIEDLVKKEILVPVDKISLINISRRKDMINIKIGTITVNDKFIILKGYTFNEFKKAHTSIIKMKNEKFNLKQLDIY